MLRVFNGRMNPVCRYKVCGSRKVDLFVAVGDVADLVPGEGALGRQPVVGLVDVQAQGVHSQEKVCSLFILNHNRRVNKSLFFLFNYPSVQGEWLAAVGALNIYLYLLFDKRWALRAKAIHQS